MIYDLVCNISRYSLISPEIAAFLNQASELTANGRYELSDGCYALVQRYITKSPLEVLPEAHRRYIDLQYIIDGSEIIEVSPLPCLKEKIAYNEEKDIAFYEPPQSGQSIRLLMKRGYFVVLYPEEAHAPCLTNNDIENVLKIVVKIPVKPIQKQGVTAKVANIKQSMGK